MLSIFIQKVFCWLGIHVNREKDFICYQCKKVINKRGHLQNCYEKSFDDFDKVLK